jgi:FKBP-type peptidyl-prolyl cis-trans isomerase
VHVNAGLPIDVAMKRPLWWLLLGLTLSWAGCAPPPPPAPPVKSEAERRREEYFGRELAADAGIAWRPTNLGIRLLAPGEGPLVQLQDRVRVHYTGRLVDGTVFDDSRARGAPAEFAVGGLIPGWSAGMLTLRPGGKALFYIPPHLGYGGLRAGKIPPFSALIFEVELLGVNPAPAAGR